MQRRKTKSPSQLQQKSRSPPLPINENNNKSQTSSHQSLDDPEQEHDLENEIVPSAVNNHEKASEDVVGSSGEKQKKVQACAKEVEEDNVSQFSNTNSYQSG